jgi:hypothetical protein
VSATPTPAAWLLDRASFSLPRGPRVMRGSSSRALRLIILKLRVLMNEIKPRSFRPVSDRLTVSTDRGEKIGAFLLDLSERQGREAADGVVLPISSAVVLPRMSSCASMRRTDDNSRQGRELLPCNSWSGRANYESGESRKKFSKNWQRRKP